MSQALQLTFFGTPRLTRSDQPLTGLLTPKALALFIYLAVTARPHSRDLLADLLWSEVNNQKARNNLRYTLADLRPIVGDYLLVTPQTLGFNRTALYQLDVEVLRTALTTKPVSDKPATLRSALDLYHDEFLAGFTVRNASVFESWVTQQREELHGLAMQGFYTLAEDYLRQGNIQAGLTTTQRLLHWEPWHEAGHRLQMHLLVAGGQRSAAVAQYNLCCTILADELGVEPEATTTALYEQIRRGGYDQMTSDKVTSDKVTSDKVTSDKVTSDKTPVDSVQTTRPTHPVTLPSSPPHNLPGQLTTFIGRATEIERIGALLTDPTQRLITLTGLGGIGKTRLALAVGQRILDFGFSIFDSVAPSSPHAENPKFPDGVWFVPLISLTDDENLTDQLATAVMDAMQLPRSGPIALLEQLLDALQHRRLLLILDNFEHLPTGVDFLITLLRRTTAVQMLVTSRHLLNLQAELVWQVEGLSIPDPATLPLLPGDAQRYDGVALFVERAQSIDRTFRLDETNQAAIFQICRFVEGLSLGIELAAAMLRYSSCDELWQTLQQDYRGLAVTHRDLAPRHRSITALFDYSWRLLTPHQAHALAACTLFPQSFTLAAAAAIADVTAATLFALIDQSLLKQSDNDRFTLHELVRQYMADQVRRDPQTVAQWRQRHADYYSRLIEPDPEELMRVPAKLQMVQQELPNLRLAWWWSVEQQQLLPIMRLSEGIFLHFLAQGPLQEGWELCNAVVELLRHRPTPPMNAADARFMALAPVGLAYLGFYQGRYAESRQLAQEAITIAQPLGDRRALTMAHGILGMVALIQGDFTAHESQCQAGLAHARAGMVRHMIVVNLAFGGLGLTLQGKLTAALATLHEALQLVHEEQFVYLEGYVLSELGLIYAMTGDWARANDTTHQALHLSQGLNNSLNRGHQYARLALSAEAIGDYTRAVTWTHRALEFSALVPDPNSQAMVLLVRGRAMRYLGNHAEAESACQQLLMLAQTLGRQTESAQARIELGHVALAQQQWQLAQAHYQAALAIVTIGQFSCQAAAQAGLAQVQWQQKQRNNALAWVEQSQQLLLTQALESQYDAAFAAITCYQLLVTVHDGRAATILQRAYDWVTAQSLRISDENLRRSFLTKAPYHRQLMDLVQTTGAGTAESTSNPP